MHLAGTDALGYIACTGTNFCLRCFPLADCGWFPTFTITEVSRHENLVNLEVNRPFDNLCLGVTSCCLPCLQSASDTFRHVAARCKYIAPCFVQSL
jgi:hypothetical protein